MVVQCGVLLYPNSKVRRMGLSLYILDAYIYNKNKYFVSIILLKDYKISTDLLIKR